MQKIGIEGHIELAKIIGIEMFSLTLRLRSGRQKAEIGFQNNIS